MNIDLMKSSSKNLMETLSPQMMHLRKFSQSPETHDCHYITSSESADLDPHVVAPAPSISLVGNPVQEPASLISPPTLPSSVFASAPLMFRATGNQELSSFGNSWFQKRNSMDAMREMIFSMAMMQPIYIDAESVKPPKRKNVKISKDPQSVAARQRRERISEKLRILQRLVPGGTKMDTASMLDEAAHYVKFLKKQLKSMQQIAKDDGPLMLNNAAGIPLTKAASSSAVNFIHTW